MNLDEIIKVTELKIKKEKEMASFIEYIRKQDPVITLNNNCQE